MFGNVYQPYPPYPPQPQPQPQPPQPEPEIPVMNPVQAIGALCVVGLCTYGLLKLFDKFIPAPDDDKPQE